MSSDEPCFRKFQGTASWLIGFTANRPIGFMAAKLIYYNLYGSSVLGDSIWTTSWESMRSTRPAWAWGRPPGGPRARHRAGHTPGHEFGSRLLPVVSRLEFAKPAGQAKSKCPFVRSKSTSDRPAVEQVSSIVSQSAIGNPIISAIHHVADRRQQRPLTCPRAINFKNDRQRSKPEFSKPARRSKGQTKRQLQQAESSWHISKSGAWIPQA